MSVADQTASFEDALTSVADVEGWMTDAQARRLWDAARRVPSAGRVVEIGSFRGRSTIILGRAAAPGVEIVAIDPHGGSDRGPNEYDPDLELGDSDHDIFHANLGRAGVAERVRHVRRTSAGALTEVTGPIELLYIDGAHRYRFAKPDIARWGPRVSAGGSLLIHDSYNAVGVMLAQLRLLFLSREFRYVGRSGSLAEYRRESLSPRGRADNALAQAASLPYFLRNCVVKLALVARLRPLARLLGEHGHWPY
ncbi:MAG TPA: class I SAM-dependent methyltransferase [Trebonia sp.]